MSSFLNTKDPKDCCGCGACVQICPQQALSLHPDEEGFFFPVLEKNRCIQCNLCIRACPADSPLPLNFSRHFFAVQAKDSQVLSESSSGGFFSVLAEHVLKLGGVVFGCSLDENNIACLQMIETSDELCKLRGSKYVSSRVENTFSQIYKLLQQKRLVLFTGTPCQVSGLKSFLGDFFHSPQLITMDFLCHGVPSETMFHSFLHQQSNRFNGPITRFLFRDKTSAGWGICTSFLCGNKKVYEKGDLSSYIYGFTRNFFNRQSCYQCIYTNSKNQSDFTVGDYWGVRQYHKNFYSEKGVSIISINTTLGQDTFQQLRPFFIVEPTHIAWASGENPDLLPQKSPRFEKVPPERTVIYRDLKAKGYSVIEQKYLRPKHRRLLVLESYVPYSVRRVMHRFQSLYTFKKER